MDNLINISKKYGVTDLGDKEDVNGLINKLKLPNSSEIIIDLSGCFLDYPNTSRVLDKVLFHLEKLESPRLLKIITDYYLPDDTLLNLLFLGSAFINITDKFRLKESEWSRIIDELKTDKNIDLEIIKSKNASA